MTLIQCPDCGQQVSDAAVACPRCARPIAPRPRSPPPPTRLPAQVQPKQGDFLDPKQNCRSILGCIAVMFIAPIALYVIAAIFAALTR